MIAAACARKAADAGEQMAVSGQPDAAKPREAHDDDSRRPHFGACYRTKLTRSQVQACAYCVVIALICWELE
jgi:hypothetical protein